MTALHQWPTARDLLKLKHRLLEFLVPSSNPPHKDVVSERFPFASAKQSPAALIGGWLKHRRESQRALARKAGISPNTLKKIIDGRPVHSAKITAVVEVLDCRYEDLLPE